MDIVKSIYSFLFAAVLLWGGPSVVFGKDVKITVEAPQSVWQNERFDLIYTLEYEDDLDALPELGKVEGFEVLYGPRVSRSYSRSFNNNKPQITYHLKMRYVVQATKDGKYNLPVLEAVSGGKKHKSKKQEIGVKSLSDTSQDQVAFVKTIISKTSVRPTDTLTVTYRLYTTMNVERIISMDTPNMTGFYVSDMSRRRQYIAEEEIDGKKYKVVDIQKLLLQPRREGVFEIPEGSVELEFSIPTGNKVRNFWGEIYDETISKAASFKLDSFTLRVFDYIEI